MQKKVYAWDTDHWSLTSDFRFLYDGWNLIAVVDSQSSLLKSFAWGLDLSGSLQSAGGVGGLLRITDYALGASAFYCYDGNGNVMALVDAADGSVSARYEYGPFGELIRATGPMAKANPFRFSTKYQDEETGWNYYGYRFLDSRMGWWLSRDPIQEAGGHNLYIFCGNDGINFSDMFGLVWAVNRDGRPRAHARPNGGDTVADLAKLIGFDDKDYGAWLVPVGPTRMPASATEPIKGCAEFSIPNHIFIDIGAPKDIYDKLPDSLFAVHKALVLQAASRWRARGFEVDNIEPASSGTIEGHLRDADLYGYIFAGHGRGFGGIGDLNTPVFPDRYTHHGIAFMELYACWSLETFGARYSNQPFFRYNQWEWNVARRGWLIGYLDQVSNHPGFADYWANHRITVPGQNSNPRRR